MVMAKIAAFAIGFFAFLLAQSRFFFAGAWAGPPSFRSKLLDGQTAFDRPEFTAAVFKKSRLDLMKIDEVMTVISHS